MIKKRAEFHKRRKYTPSSPYTVTDLFQYHMEPLLEHSRNLQEEEAIDLFIYLVFVVRKHQTTKNDYRAVQMHNWLETTKQSLQTENNSMQQ